jgi:PD-(D/E)XK nuclease superfamily
MQMDGGDAGLLEPVTERIIGCAFRVANALGHGFVEKVDENPLAHEMRKCGLGAVQQRKIVVLYDDRIVGEFNADLPGRGPGHRRTQGGRRAERPASPAMPELLAGDRQALMPADQLRPVQSRSPPRHTLLRVLSRPTLIARTIPFIPAIPFIRLKRPILPPRHCPADPGKTLLGWRQSRRRSPG